MPGVRALMLVGLYAGCHDFDVVGILQCCETGVACSECPIFSKVEQSCNGKHVHGDFVGN